MQPCASVAASGLVHRGDDRSLEGRAKDHPWRSATLFSIGRRHGAATARVFRLALRQTEGLIGSILALLGLDLAVPDHSTLSRRAETLEVASLRPGSAPVHLLVDGIGLKLCGSGEWLLEKHGTRTRRSWRKLHVGVDADTGRNFAAVLTTNDVDDASQLGILLDQAGPLASFTADGAMTRTASMARSPDARPDGHDRATAFQCSPKCRAAIWMAAARRSGWLIATALG